MRFWAFSSHHHYEEQDGSAASTVGALPTMLVTPFHVSCWSLACALPQPWLERGCSTQGAPQQRAWLPGPCQQTASISRAKNPGFAEMRLMERGVPETLSALCRPFGHAQGGEGAGDTASNLSQHPAEALNVETFQGLSLTCRLFAWVRDVIRNNCRVLLDGNFRRLLKWKKQPRDYCIYCTVMLLGSIASSRSR